jgi:hypothetical protein
MIRQAFLCSGLLMLAGGAAAAAPGSMAESNGFRNCVSAAERVARFLRVDSRYLVRENTGSRTLYLNGSGRLDDRAGSLRIACETTPGGHRVLAVTVEEGRFAPRMTEDGALAAN